MAETKRAKVTSIHIRERKSLLFPAKESEVQWRDAPPKKRGEDMTKNIAVSAALVLCAVTLRTGAIPSLTEATDVVMTASTDNSLLDEQLGKLSFVSTLFPEAVLVFNGQPYVEMAMPVSEGEVVHAWSASEPYMTWRTDSAQITSVCEGEVIGVYHGNGEERLVQVLANNGISCLYGNLREVNVKTGDAVTVGSVLGTLLSDSELVFEVRRDGRSINPNIYFNK